MQAEMSMQSALSF